MVDDYDIPLSAEKSIYSSIGMEPISNTNNGSDLYSFDTPVHLAIKTTRVIHVDRLFYFKLII
jgi:hypothetical protein